MSAMPTVIKGQQKVPFLKKTTVLCHSRSYYSVGILQLCITRSWLWRFQLPDFQMKTMFSLLQIYSPATPGSMGGLGGGGEGGGEGGGKQPLPPRRNKATFKYQNSKVFQPTSQKIFKHDFTLARRGSQLSVCQIL